MAFVTDKEELKPGLIIFRRADVQHRNWYCRVKLPKADRYKTLSLKTEDVNVARTLAWDQDGEVRYATKRGDPIFNRAFRDVAKEFFATQIARAKRGEISKGRPEKVRNVIEGALEDYVGSTQVHRIGDDLWTGYPTWRRENGEGRAERNGGRKVSGELAIRLVTQDQAMLNKGRVARNLRAKVFTTQETEDAVAKKLATSVPFISDATIRFEMSIFAMVMQHAIKKRYVPASQRFEDRPKLKIMRRDEFTGEEYRRLYDYARTKWVKGKTGDEEPMETAGTPGKAKRPEQKAVSNWYRSIAYNFLLIMCNTGMRPSEARNLRWRDISTAKDRDGRDMVVLFVQGKGKSRKLVAPASVGTYLDRIRAISKAKELDDPVFTTIDGTPTGSLYKRLIDDLLTKAGLRIGPCGTIRSTYSFRHTYATFRLSEGTDVYFLAEQMGTSVKMIEDHYGHVNTIKHADRVLQGMNGWEAMHAEAEAEPQDGKAKEANAKGVQAAKMRQPSPRLRGKK